jgi:carbamoyl-phosphate synthase large subunit
LVLSVGTQVGQNVLSVLSGRRDGLVLIATSSVANEPAVFDYDAVYLAPPTAAEPAAFERLLLEIMDRERIDLVIPCRDDDVLFLASLRDRRSDLAPRLLCGGATAASVIVDKWLSAEFCAQRGLPFAPSIAGPGVRDGKAFAGNHGFPLVGKPRRGYASQEVYLLFNEAQLERVLAREGWIVQKFLGDPRTVTDYLAGIETDGVPLYHTFQGLKHSIQALIAPDGSPAHVICTRNMSKQRRSKWVEPDPDDRSRRLGTACAEAFAAEGWRGPLNIQCQKSADGALFIHEFNGRFTGATVDRWLLGYDEVGAAIERFTGRSIASTHEPRAASLEAFESLIARGADPRKVESLTRNRVWRRTP